MGRLRTVRDRLAGSPVALAATVIVVLGALAALLVSQIGLPPREALFPTGVAVAVLALAVYDWYARR
ncbi:hypothetical protein [Halapricum desulfuricans]|uniref:Uncharacterized protein n=1 Tax=Halapricum desulfuricans TaxID=2841257 RepID=A0A897NBQ5_9EURY|nr:hypothetical protein [Halapricum desulfuricans]QSG09854.1 hypothetical protein HSR122_2478 [Halapricum desulfuricans]